MKPNKLLKCKLCGTKTQSVYNVNFKAVPVCNRCGNSVFLQHADWLVKNDKTMGLKRILKAKWLKNGYDVALVNDVLDLMSNKSRLDNDKEWIAVPDLKFLTCVQEHTHEYWQDLLNSEVDLRTVEDDIKLGVTFAFYTMDSKLAWER